MKFRELSLRKNPDCPVCGTNPSVTKLIDYHEFCGMRGEEGNREIEVPEIEPIELKRRLDAGEEIVILDVREPHEYQICDIGGYLIPLLELPQRIHEFDSSGTFVIHCRSGVRSAEAVDFMMKAGFGKIFNLRGGILAWSDQADPTLPKY